MGFPMLPAATTLPKVGLFLESVSRPGQHARAKSARVSRHGSVPVQCHWTRHGFRDVCYSLI